MRLAHIILAAATALVLSAPAAAHEVQYGAELTGVAEIPPNASPGTGSVLVTVDLDTLMMRVQISFADLLGTTSAAHIHCCTLVPGAANVGVATPVPTFPGFPSGVTSGSYDASFNMALASSYNPGFVTLKGGVSNAFSALLAGMDTGNAYMNLHTTAFPGGEIRGLMHPVPEPAMSALMLSGLALLGLAAQRRKRV